MSTQWMIRISPIPWSTDTSLTQIFRDQVLLCLFLFLILSAIEPWKLCHGGLNPSWWISKRMFDIDHRDHKRATSWLVGAWSRQQLGRHLLRFQHPPLEGRGKHRDHCFSAAWETSVLQLLHITPCFLRSGCVETHVLVVGSVGYKNLERVAE